MRLDQFMGLMSVYIPVRIIPTDFCSILSIMNTSLCTSHPRWQKGLHLPPHAFLIEKFLPWPFVLALPNPIVDHDAFNLLRSRVAAVDRVHVISRRLLLGPQVESDLSSCARVIAVVYCCLKPSRPQCRLHL